MRKEERHIIVAVQVPRSHCSTYVDAVAKTVDHYVFFGKRNMSM